jgi:hypothetical protein
MRGEKHAMAKRSDAEVALLRQRWIAGEYRSLAVAGRAFNISGTYVGYMIEGRFRKEWAVAGDLPDIDKAKEA